jgi:hypothetical protein
VLIGIFRGRRRRRNNRTFASSFATTTADHGESESDYSDRQPESLHACLFHIKVPAPFFVQRVLRGTSAAEKKDACLGLFTATVKASRFRMPRGHVSIFPAYVAMFDPARNNAPRTVPYFCRLPCPFFRRCSSRFRLREIFSPIHPTIATAVTPNP